jgi:lysyl-tRNA synthetase class 1
MVIQAFKVLAPEIPVKLFCLSDDMDGLRKVPDNVPNKEIIEPHLGKPLTQIPDPFGTDNSFGEHNNNRLKAFLDDFGFEYEFKSATELYTTGVYDAALLKVLQNYDAIINVILPTLGEERRATYSPFFPVCPETGEVLQVPVKEVHPEKGTIVYENKKGELVETEVTGGKCKLQWKVDWAMRWHALGVDYEMCGKDLTDSVKLSSKICRILGSTPPQNLIYELFLDEKGEKISKSKGNGLAVEDWLKYAPQESLSLYMFQKPKTAKRLYFDVIPRAVDEYLGHVRGFETQEEKARFNNPAWHIHNGDVPAPEAGISMNILLNLVSVCGSDDADTIWHYISGYEKDATPENSPYLNKLVGFAIAYYKDFVLPNKKFKTPDETDMVALKELREKIGEMQEGASGQDVQQAVYEVGKAHYENLKDWFKALYQIILGQDMGPRMGSVFALFGIKESVELIDKVIAGKSL